MNDDWKAELGNTLSLGVVIMAVLIALLDFFHAPIFLRETMSIKAQVLGQEMVNLFLAVPATLYALRLSKKGSLKARTALIGLMAFFAYTYLSYNILFKLNDGFLLYAAAFGLSLYATLLNIAALDLKQLQIEATPSIRKWTPVLMGFILLVILLLWTPDLVHYYTTGLYPDTLIEQNVHTLAIHFQDLSIIIPLALLTTWLIRKDENMGYILAPIVLVKIVSIGIGVIGMILVMQYLGTPADIGGIMIFLIATTILGWFTAKYYQGIKIVDRLIHI